MNDFDNVFNRAMKNQPVDNISSDPMPSTANKKLEAGKAFTDIQLKLLDPSKNVEINDASKLISLFKSKSIPEFNVPIMNMVMNLDGSILDGVLNELLIVLASELGGDGGLDFSFLVQLVKRLDEVIKSSSKKEIVQPEFKRILNANSLPNAELKKAIQTILQGINQLDQAQTSEAIKNTDPKIATPAAPTSTQVEVLGASGKINYPVDGFEDWVLEGNEFKTVDDSIKVKATDKDVTADIVVRHPKDESVISHAKAFGTLGNKDLQRVMNPYISAIMQISNIQPLFIISPIASQLIVQMGRLVEDANLFKVAIVTDNVAALREIDPVDYIRKVPATDQPQYAIYEKYKQLYDEGYHYIISLHLNPNLKKTYKAALEAKKQIDSQNVDDLEISVYNTNANGVGLGLMIYELVDAIKNNYSPLEVNKLTEQLVKNYRHWVCPLEFDFVKNHQWVMDLADTQKKVQMRLFHFIPVIELDRKLTIVNVSYTKEAAFSTLMKQIENIIESRDRKVNRICVEYRGVFREAIKIRNQIKVKCPSVKVSLQSVGSLTTQFFGPELVGICII